MKSQCCKAKLTAVGNVTKYYKCSDCGEATDPMEKIKQQFIKTCKKNGKA